MRAVRVIDDLETLRLIAEPTRAAIVELLAEPRSVTQLAEALDVPRTRLYHHIELLRSKGIVQQVDARRVGPMTERIYRLTAKTFRPSARMLRGDDDDARDALMTLLFDTTKSDLRRAASSGGSASAGTETRPLGLGRSIAFLDARQAAEFISEVDALVARFDKAHRAGGDRRPYALVWALYPSSRTLR
jgi:DNA-binding transcriptional ArsR family regulator